MTFEVYNGATCKFIVLNQCHVLHKDSVSVMAHFSESKSWINNSCTCSQLDEEEVNPTEICVHVVNLLFNPIQSLLTGLNEETEKRTR